MERALLPRVDDDFGKLIRIDELDSREAMSNAPAPVTMAAAATMCTSEQVRALPPSFLAAPFMPLR